MHKPFRAVVAALLCLLLLPAVARAQDSPFAPLPQGQQPTATQTTPAPTKASDPDGGGLTSFEQVLLAVAGALVLGGVAFLIVRDARQAAPVTEREMRAERSRELDTGRGTRPTSAARKTANRKRNKATKAARRHNR